MSIGYENIMMQFTFQLDERHSPKEYGNSTRDVSILHKNARALKKKRNVT